MSRDEIDVLLDAISPRLLRDKFQLPFSSWREEFQPRFLTTDSYEEMLSEAERFTAPGIEQLAAETVDQERDVVRRELQGGLAQGGFLHGVLAQQLYPHGHPYARNLCCNRY